MSKPIKLSTARLTATIGDVNDPATWRQFEVQTTNLDNIHAENELVKSKRGSIQDHPILLTTMMAYFALKRTKQIASGTYADFEAGCIDIESVEGDDVDPTPEVPDPG